MDMRKMSAFGIHFVIRVSKQQKNERTSGSFFVHDNSNADNCCGHRKEL